MVGNYYRSPFPQHSPEFFTRNSVVCFLQVDKTCVKVFGLLPRFLKNLLESEILVCSAMARMKTALGIIQLWFKYFAASFFKALGNVNVKYLKISEKALRAARKALAGHMPPVDRVFETPGLMIQ